MQEDSVAMSRIMQFFPTCFRKGVIYSFRIRFMGKRKNVRGWLQLQGDYREVRGDDPEYECFQNIHKKRKECLQLSCQDPALLRRIPASRLWTIIMKPIPSVMSLQIT